MSQREARTIARETSEKRRPRAYHLGRLLVEDLVGERLDEHLPVGQLDGLIVGKGVLGDAARLEGENGAAEVAPALVCDAKPKRVRPARRKASQEHA